MPRKLTPGKLVIASHNAGKVREIRALLEPFGVEPVSAGDLGLPEPEETGTTFAENARLKAHAAAQGSGLPALADDSGLCVAALGGRPGVYTADWAERQTFEGPPGRDWYLAMGKVEGMLAEIGFPAAGYGLEVAQFFDQGLCQQHGFWYFEAERSFRQAVDYTENRKVRNSRQARAMAKGTRYGRESQERAWQSAEVDALFRLAAAGVRVPRPLQFLDGVLTACLPHVEDAAPIYMWHAHVQQPTVAAAFARHGLLLHQVLVLVKPCAVFGHSYYRWRHEPCAFGWRQGSKPEHGVGQLDTVWEVDWEGKQRVVGNEHPTQKPVLLFEIPMEQHTRPGDIVLEPFSGSGSQLIASERLGRRCRANELCPAFVDVALRRWEKATGKQAVLDGSGKTFAEIAKERGA